MLVWKATRLVILYVHMVNSFLQPHVEMLNHCKFQHSNIFNRELENYIFKSTEKQQK